MKTLLIPLVIVFVIFSIAFTANGQGSKTKVGDSKLANVGNLKFQIGEHPTDFLKRNPQIVTRLKILLGKTYPEFYRGLSVSSGFQKSGKFYIVSGIAPHSMGLDSYLGFSEDYSLNNPKSQIYVLAKGFETGNYVRFYTTDSSKKIPIEIAIEADVDTEKFAEKIFLPDYMFSGFADDTQKLIVPDFLGNSIWRIYNILNERQEGIYKDEFETTAQFTNRKKTELLKPIMGTIIIGNKVAFRSTVSTLYDADNSEWKLTFPKVPCALKSGTLLNIPDYACVEVTSELEISSYFATSEYGRQIEIQKSEWQVYGLLIQKANKWNTEKEEYPLKYSEDFALKVKMNVDKAKQVKENLEILFVGTIIEPYTVEGFQKTTPTIQSPKEELHNKHFLVFDLDRILLFDKSNGEVVKVIRFVEAGRSAN